MDVLLNWVLRGVIIVLGAGAGVWIFRWLRGAWGTAEERWPLRLAVGMLVLAAIYAGGHLRLLAQRADIEEGRAAYVRYGDPRRTELRRAEVRGWIHDCTGEPDNALALYSARGGVVERTYPLGQAGANLIGGGEDAGDRDYTIEQLFDDNLRQPLGLGELGELHPAGTDLRLTLCGDLTATAWELLSASGEPGAVVMQDVNTGAIVAYASTGGPDQPPIGIQEYSAPGSVFKLALAAVWWEYELPDTVLGCPPSIQLTDRATISNSEGFDIARVSAPAEMLVFSCNTTAVKMALIARDRLGEQAFVDMYRRFGFEPYTDSDDQPGGFDRGYWLTASDDWDRRMSPPPARIRIGAGTGRAEWGQLAIGQGPVDVTPIHISNFLQAIGNDGVMRQPTIEWEVLEDADVEDDGVATRVMSAETAARLQSAMRGVVDRGTGRSAGALVDGLAWDLGGKTGTAQVANAADNGWFAGLIHGPDGEPRYTVVVFLRGGGPGGRGPAAIAAGLTRTAATLNRAAAPSPGEEG
jgi:cell division protein FtsI/penicillin-binding protein 2